MFEVGKDVYCLESSDHFTKNDIYPLLGIKEGCSHYPLLLDIGVKATGGTTICNKCKHNTGGSWWDATMFAPIDSMDISEVTEILKEQTQEV